MTTKTLNVSANAMGSAADMIRDHIQEAPTDAIRDELTKLADDLGSAAMAWTRLAIVVRGQ